MPHEVETMAYAGEVPWHGLGTKVKGLMTVHEALAAAGLDWEVELANIFIETKGVGVGLVEQWKAVRRLTDRKVFGIVGAKYEPIQNKDAFKFFDEVVGSGQAIYETAGALQEGRRIWILANMKGSIGIRGDEVKKYITLTNSHDGTLALQMFWTPIRVVCMNTLRMALSGARESFYCRHTLNAPERIAAAREILGLANKFYEEWKAQARHLAVLALPAPKIPLLLKAAFDYPEDKPMGEIYDPMRVQMDKAKELIYTGRGQDNPKIQGTAWQAYNGIVEYADYYRPYRSEAPDARLRGAWFGTGMDIKKRAWEYLTNLK